MGSECAMSGFARVVEEGSMADRVLVVADRSMEGLDERSRLRKSRERGLNEGIAQRDE